MDSKIKHEKRYRRHKRVRAKILGTAKAPRLSIFRSAKHIYGQLIDDEKAATLASASDTELSSEVKNLPFKKEEIEENQKMPKKTKIALAFEVGKLIARKALEKKIEKVVFDRSGYKYHGRVKAFAEGAREGGLKF